MCSMPDNGRDNQMSTTTKKEKLAPFIPVFETLTSLALAYLNIIWFGWYSQRIQQYESQKQHQREAHPIIAKKGRQF